MASESRDRVATYTALFEALNWAAAVDDRTDQDLLLWKKRDKYAWRTRVHGAEIMGGIRFIRNSVHHDWSNAVQIDENGLSFPVTYPVMFFEWVWRPADDLPPPGQRQHPDAERFYREEMQGRPVRHSLHTLRHVFRTLHVMLEPTTFTSERDPADYYPYPAGAEGIPPD